MMFCLGWIAERGGRPLVCLPARPHVKMPRNNILATNFVKKNPGPIGLITP